ncbi:MAG TPA: hypothetical protein VMH80_28505 [Bryobacteraceae bacterium]|nr:hypothetical protein [Bryobacteraceae bacterium]
MECWKTVQLLRARVDAGRALFIPAGETIEVITSQGLTPRVFWRGCKDALDGLQVNASDLFAKAQWIGQSPRAD